MHASAILLSVCFTAMTIDHRESEPEEIGDLVDILDKRDVALEKIDSFELKMRVL